MPVKLLVADLRHLGFLFGPPPRAARIRRGNCRTGDIERLAREFGGESLTALLVLD